MIKNITMSEKAPETKRPRGRPKGSAAVAGRERSRALAQAEIKPLDVMLQTMADRWKAAQSSTDIEERAKLQDAACTVAEKVAPYLHARLQATTIKGDADAPLFSVSLPASDVLRAMVRGIEDKN